jgi:hypothetical protein
MNPCAFSSIPVFCGVSGPSAKPARRRDLGPTFNLAAELRKLK